MAPSQSDASGPDERIGDLVRALPRREPPPVPLEAILSRWQRQRKQRFTAIAGGIAAAAVLFLALPSEPPAPPEHLFLRVVDVTTATVDSVGPNAGALAETNLTGVPEELRVP